MLKKMIFGLMTVCLLILTWSACSEKKAPQEAEVLDVENMLEPKGDTPLEKMASLMENYVNYLKDKHIKAEADVKEMESVSEKLQEITDRLGAEAEKWNESLTEADKDKLTGKMALILTKIDQYAEEAESEAKRLGKEAEENGLSLDDADSNP